MYLLSAGMIAKHGFPEASRRAYNVCRGASNAMSLQWLNNCVTKKVNIKHGTTLTGKPSRNLLKGLKNNGYRTRIFVCLASEDTILECLTHRLQHQAYHQSTPEDELAKVKMFFDRLPMYFEEGDIVDVFYKPSLMERHIQVGHYTPKAANLTNSSSTACLEANALIARHYEGMDLMDLMLGMAKER
jgi:hypothetical protein